MRRAVDRLFTFAAAFMAIAAVTMLVTVVGLVLSKGAGSMSWTFLTTDSESAGAKGGVLYHIVGTLILIGTAAMFAVPVAAGTGIFLHLDLALRPTLRNLVESALHALNGVPSIVFGLFGLAVFVRFFGLQKSWLAGGVILAMMIIPTLTIAFVEKLRAIPPATIEAAYGLGLGRNALVRSVLLPQAASGLVTGTLLGLARAAGETAPIMFTAAIFSGATIPRGIVDSPVLALPYHIFVLAQDVFDPAAADRVWTTALVVLMLAGVLLLLAIPARLRVHEEARRV